MFGSKIKLARRRVDSTCHLPSGKKMVGIFDASLKYKEKQNSINGFNLEKNTACGFILVIWRQKATFLLGIKKFGWPKVMSVSQK